MVTSAFKDVIDSYIERVKNIFAYDKKGYDAEMEILKQQLKDDLDALQLRYPLLAAYNRQVFEDNPSLLLDVVAKSAVGVNALKHVAVDGYIPIQIEAADDIVCQPNVIDISEVGNIVMSADKNSSSSLQELILNMLLSVEVGKLHLSFINLEMSDVALPVISNLESSLYDVITNYSELAALEKRMNDILKLKVTTGSLAVQRTEVVVVLDYNECKGKLSEQFSVLFNKGKVANIHFVLHDSAPIIENEGKGLLSSKSYFAYSPFPLSFVETTLCHCSKICELPNLREACFKYINEGIETEDDKQVDFSSVPYEVTTSAINAPIGIGENGEVIDFKMDVNKGHYHAFVIGETGSGKSRFLHDIIINMIGKYSPEDVELYLMDFKGVEFNDYRDIKHSRVVLVDRADERITYEVIRELKEKMDERQRILASSGASDVDEFNKRSGDKHLSQIVLIADECQTLFSDRTRNNRLQNEMIDIIALVAQQGRAYGVHLVLATQSLSNAPLLGKEILNQIGEHYILPCLPADARRLVPDHEQQDTEKVVSKMEKGKGQCYYQGADGKFLFTFNYISKGEQQDNLIKTAKDKCNDYESNGQVYFSGSLQYEITEDAINFASSKGRKNIVASPGQAVAISQSPVVIQLHEDLGENIMLLGINDRHYVTRTTINTLVSLIATSQRKGLNYDFVVMDCMKCEDDEPYMDVLDELDSKGLCRFVRPRDRKNTLYQLCKDITNGNAKPTILTIIGEETFRELKFDENFDIPEENSTPSGTGANSLDDALAMMSMLSNSLVSQPQANADISNIKTVSSALEYILDKGPENGVHTIMQLDRADNFYIANDGYLNSKNIYSRFCHLIILRSNEKDIPVLKLPDEMRPEMFEDNPERLRAYYYNEGSNRFNLFTPFMMPSIELINNILK